MEQLYKFNNRDFNENGNNVKDCTFFLEVIGKWEKDFHERFSPIFSNCLLGNASTMILVRNCFITEPHEDFGMDLINGNIDIETNIKIGSCSKRLAIYAIGSSLDEDEPVFLVRDDDIVDGMVILKYVPDGGDEDEVSPVIPMGMEKLGKLI